MTTGFFEFSKIIWGFLAPDSVMVLILLAGMVALLKGRRRLAISLVGSVLAFMVTIGFLPLGHWLLRPLESQYPANPPLHDVAGIIILGGAASPELTDRWKQPAMNDAADRFLAGAEIARRFPRARIYFSGGNARASDGTSEASIARQILVTMGVDPRRITLEGRSRSTAENAAFLRAMVPRQSVGQWVLVTSAFHMPRAMPTFCSAGWTGLIAYPTDYRTTPIIYSVGWALAEHLTYLNLGGKEWIGLAAYRLTGRAVESCSRSSSR